MKRNKWILKFEDAGINWRYPGKLWGTLRGWEFPSWRNWVLFWSISYTASEGGSSRSTWPLWLFLGLFYLLFLLSLDLFLEFLHHHIDWWEFVWWHRRRRGHRLSPAADASQIPCLSRGDCIGVDVIVAEVALICRFYPVHFSLTGSQVGPGDVYWGSDGIFAGETHGVLFSESFDLGGE